MKLTDKEKAKHYDNLTKSWIGEDGELHPDIISEIKRNKEIVEKLKKIDFTTIHCEECVCAEMKKILGEKNDS